MSSIPYHFLYHQDNLMDRCAELSLEWDEYAPMNEFHGNNAVLKEYASLDASTPLPFMMEHAIPYDLEEAYDYDLNSGLIDYFAVTEASARLYQKNKNLKVTVIGSTFHYALLNYQKIHGAINTQEKKGTLFFPDKSTLLMDTDFDRSLLCHKLKSLPEKYQPVVVCIYWKDYIRGNHQPYLDAGIPVVSCGHLKDAEFQMRLINLCIQFKYSAANDISSSFVYSVLAGCEFFHLPLQGVQMLKNGENHFYDEDPSLNKPHKKKAKKLSQFGNTDFLQQLIFAKELSGYSFIKTPAEILSLYLQAKQSLTQLAISKKTVFNNHIDKNQWIAFLPQGLDWDGWAKKTVRLILPAHRMSQYIQFTLVAPSKKTQCIEVQVQGELRYRWKVNNKRRTFNLDLSDYCGDVTIQFDASKEFPLGNETRHRSFLIQSIEWLDSLSILNRIYLKLTLNRYAL
jgi:hypothetical protein